MEKRSHASDTRQAPSALWVCFGDPPRPASRAGSGQSLPSPLARKSPKRHCSLKADNVFKAFRRARQAGRRRLLCSVLEGF